MEWQQKYLDRYYRSRASFVDGTTEFWQVCAAHVPPGSRIVEIGAGPGNETSRFLASRGELHGVDVDEEVRRNPHLCTASVVRAGDRLPFEDDFIDACVSNYVLEHVEAPDDHLREVARVLRPGGSYLFRTPNRWHYVAIAARLTPHSIHELVANRARGLSDSSHAPYPTYYRLNSRRAVRRAAANAGLETIDLRMIEKEPSYGMAARPLFLAFMAYERVVNASELLGDLRANIIGVLRKPAA